MEVLFILGNGFDINLGLKTSYQDFYDYYQGVTDSDNDITALKESIKKGRYHNWSDLEDGLGKYSAELQSPEVFLKCLADIKKELVLFLNQQYSKRAFESNPEKIGKSFLHPEKYLDDRSKDLFVHFLESIFPPLEDGYHFSVVSFNYTNSLEELLALYERQNRVSIPILHIHGRLDSDIVMGVSDDEQIANQEFRFDRDTCEEFIKPSYNDACLNSRNTQFETMIEEADVIVLFGLSLGTSDRKWWRLIGNRMMNKARESALLYFPYDEKKDTKRHPNYRLRWNEGYREILMKALEIPDESLEAVLKRTFIGLNKTIFQMPIRQ